MQDLYEYITSKKVGHRLFVGFHRLSIHGSKSRTFPKHSIQSKTTRSKTKNREQNY